MEGPIGSLISSDILSEGFGMLRSLILDFREAGHNVTTLLSSQLAAYNPPIEANNVIPVSTSQEARTYIENYAKSFDAAYMLGPEMNRKFHLFLKTVENSGLRLLNCSTKSIEMVADKSRLYNSLKKKGIKMPKTASLDLLDEPEAVKNALEDRFEFPLIFKPSDRVGCCGLSLVGDETEIPRAIELIKKESENKHFLVQEHVQGIPASVSLITTGDETFPMSLNKQNVILSGPESTSRYMGGLVPFRSSFASEAINLAKVTVESFRDLKGYVGVDLVLTERGPVVLEVNPRLTTSYIGLRRVVTSNIGQAITDAVLHDRLPENIRLLGYSCFSKVRVPCPTIEALHKSYAIKEVISPPFPIGESKAQALLLFHSSKIKETAEGLKKVEKSFLNTVGENK